MRRLLAMLTTLGTMLAVVPTVAPQEQDEALLRVWQAYAQVESLESYQRNEISSRTYHEEVAFDNLEQPALIVVSVQETTNRERVVVRDDAAEPNLQEVVTHEWLMQGNATNRSDAVAAELRVVDGVVYARTTAASSSDPQTANTAFNQWVVVHHADEYPQYAQLFDLRPYVAGGGDGPADVADLFATQPEFYTVSVESIMLDGEQVGERIVVTLNAEGVMNLLFDFAMGDGAAMAGAVVAGLSMPDNPSHATFTFVLDNDGYLIESTAEITATIEGVNLSSFTGTNVGTAATVVQHQSITVTYGQFNADVDPIRAPELE